MQVYLGETMEQCVITTVTGPFSADVLTKLAHTSRALGAKWLTTKIIRVDRQFCAMMKTIVDAENLNPLKSLLANSFPTLTFVHASCNENSNEMAQTKIIIFDCSDRAGLTQDINQVLNSLNIDILQQENHRIMVAGVSETVYRAKIIVQLPEIVSNSDVIGQLNLLADQARITIE